MASPAPQPVPAIVRKMEMFTLDVTSFLPVVAILKFMIPETAEWFSVITRRTKLDPDCRYSIGSDQFTDSQTIYI